MNKTHAKLATCTRVKYSKWATLMLNIALGNRRKISPEQRVEDSALSRHVIDEQEKPRNGILRGSRIISKSPRLISSKLDKPKPIIPLYCSVFTSLKEKSLWLRSSCPFYVPGFFPFIYINYTYFQYTTSVLCTFIRGPLDASNYCARIRLAMTCWIIYDKNTQNVLSLRYANLAFTLTSSLRIFEEFALFSLF